MVNRRRFGLWLAVAAWLLAACGNFSIDFEVDSAPPEFEADDPLDPVESQPDIVDSELDSELPSESFVRLDRVVDGDSIDVIDSDGREVEVRLVGYNAPELFNDDNERTCNGDRARSELEAMLGESAQLTVLDEGIDRYGRLLADIALPVDAEQPTVVAALVASGTGLATGDDERHRQLMVEAAGQGLGMWGSQCGEPLHTDLVIAETQVNPEGNDRFNLAEEWVSIRNRSSSDVSLQGWVLRDDTTGHRFGLAGTLSPSAELKVRTGDGRDDTENFYLDESFPVWSNQWETVILVDPNGVLAHWVFVG